MTQRSGERVAGRYVIAEALGRHPAYQAYRVADTEAEVDVELWLVAAELVPGRAERAAFGHAATAARELTHANARRVFDAGETHDSVFVAVQLASGPSLPARLAAGQPLSDTQVLGYASALCDALVAAHSIGLVHGLLIPDDVVEIAGAIKLGGVGLWGAASHAAVRQAWGDSLRYVAPEARRGELTPLADSYSVASILLELAVGADARWRIEGDPRALCERAALERPDLPIELRAAVSEDPARRPSIGGLAAALRQALIDDKVPTAAMVRLPPPADGASPRPDTQADTAVVRNRRGESPPAELPGEPGVLVEELDLLTPTPTPMPGFGPGGERKLPLAAEPSQQFVRPYGLDDDDPTRDLDADSDLPTVARAAGPEHAVESPGAAAAVDGAVGGRSAGAPERALTRAPTVPRIGAGLRPPGRRVGRIAVAAVAAAAAGLGAWAGLVAVWGKRGATSPAPPESTLPAPRPPAVAPVVEELEPCPEDMAFIDRGALKYCIDRYESPGKGQLPQVNLSMAEAQARCEDRLARLCAPEEWELACRGPQLASFPYGEAYRREVCNAALGRDSAVAPAGSYQDCVTSEGVFDLSGNVAEWVADGRPRGGSSAFGDEGRCSRRRRIGEPRGYDDVGFRCCREAARPPEASQGR